MIRRHQNKGGVKFQVYEKAVAFGKSVRFYVGSFDTEREAKAAGEDHRVRQRMLKSGELSAKSDPRRTLGAALEEWFAHLDAKQHRSRVPYKSRITNHVTTALQNTPVASVTDDQLTDLRDALERKRSAKDPTATLSAATVNGVLASLSSAYEWFIGKKWVKVNPFASVKALKATEREPNWIKSSADVTRLLGACGSNIRTLIAVLVGTGMRIDEALHLEWEDVDLERRELRVHRGRQGKTKSGKGRLVPIGDGVLPVLRAMKLASGGGKLLWPGRRRAQAVDAFPRNQSGVFRAFKAALERAGMPLTLRLHDLRHSFASQYVSSGGDIYKLSKILGHSSVKITEKVYAHLAPEAHHADYGRVSFAMPDDAVMAKVIPIAAAAVPAAATLAVATPTTKWRKR